LDRSEPQPLAQALDRARRIGGSHAGEFRTVVGRRLSDPVRTERMVRIATGAERPPLIQAWTQLQPAEVGPALLAVLPLGQDPPARLQIATAILARIDSCAPQLDEVLRRGAGSEVIALLSASTSLPPEKRGELGAAASGNADQQVKLEAIPL